MQCRDSDQGNTGVEAVCGSLEQKQFPCLLGQLRCSEVNSLHATNQANRKPSRRALPNSQYFMVYSLLILIVLRQISEVATTVPKGPAA